MFGCTLTRPFSAPYWLRRGEAVTLTHAGPDICQAAKIRGGAPEPSTGLHLFAVGFYGAVRILCGFACILLHWIAFFCVGISP